MCRPLNMLLQFFFYLFLILHVFCGHCNKLTETLILSQLLSQKPQSQGQPMALPVGSWKPVFLPLLASGAHGRSLSRGHVPPVSAPMFTQLLL